MNPIRILFVVPIYREKEKEYYSRAVGRESIAHPAFSIIPTRDLARYHLPRIQNYECPFHVFRSRVSVNVPAAWTKKRTCRLEQKRECIAAWFQFNSILKGGMRFAFPPYALIWARFDDCLLKFLSLHFFIGWGSVYWQGDQKVETSLDGSISYW